MLCGKESLKINHSWPLRKTVERYLLGSYLCYSCGYSSLVCLKAYGFHYRYGDGGCLVAKLRLTLLRPSGLQSVRLLRLYGISQARLLELVAISFSMQMKGEGKDRERNPGKGWE